VLSVASWSLQELRPCKSAGRRHSFSRNMWKILLNGRRMRVWDAALDQGPSGTIASLAILKLLCKTTFADRRCLVETLYTYFRQILLWVNTFSALILTSAQTSIH